MNSIHEDKINTANAIRQSVCKEKDDLFFGDLMKMSLGSLKKISMGIQAIQSQKLELMK